MKPVVEDNLTIRKYLLGELSHEEQAEVEERLFLDSEYFQHLRMAEDDLIDDYVYEDLSLDEREKFDNYFLSNPERYESLRIARALRKYSSINPTPIPSASSNDVSDTAPSKIAFLSFLHAHNPVLRLSMATAILLIALGGLWLIFRATRRPGTPEPVQVQLPQQQEKEQNMPPNANREEHRAGVKEDVGREPEQRAGQQNQEQPIIAAERERESRNTREQREQARKSASPVKQPPARVYSFLILPVGTTRDEGEVNKIDLPSDATAAHLQLPLIGDTDYRSYQATLTTHDDKSIRTWTGLKTTAAESGRIVSIRVPAELLRQQTYQVKLSGLTAKGIARDISSYSFHVNKR
jgi:hypothetical protein